MITGTAILALGFLGVLDALLNPTAFKGDATSAAWAFLLVFVIPGSLLFVFGWRARISFTKTSTQNPGDRAVILRSTAADERTKGQPTVIVGRIAARETFAVDVEITRYAEVYQSCYELLMKNYGEGAPVLGAWTTAPLRCASCARAFPSSFKLHLTSPSMFGSRQPRSDCPDCGSRIARIGYSPPPGGIQRP
ncbi:MAG: hypothetical protein LAO31_19635 [Acidobacteriia bacterium]|nr:hypothetical protein [Terriglobia bacterium]